MTKDELITKQQLEIESLRGGIEENKRIRKMLLNKFYSIGAPLNDNVLMFNKAQIEWCFKVVELIKEI